MPILIYKPKLLADLDLSDGDNVRVNFENGEIVNLRNNKSGNLEKFYDAQMAIYRNGGLL